MSNCTSGYERFSFRFQPLVLHITHPCRATHSNDHTQGILQSNVALPDNQTFKLNDGNKYSYLAGVLQIINRLPRISGNVYKQYFAASLLSNTAMRESLCTLTFTLVDEITQTESRPGSARTRQQSGINPHGWLVGLVGWHHVSLPPKERRRAPKNQSLILTAKHSCTSMRSN